MQTTIHNPICSQKPNYNLACKRGNGYLNDFKCRDLPANRPGQFPIKPHVPNLKPRVPNLKPRAPNLKPRAPDLKPRVPDLKMRVSNVKPRVPNFNPSVPLRRQQQPSNLKDLLKCGQERESFAH